MKTPVEKKIQAFVEIGKNKKLKLKTCFKTKKKILSRMHFVQRKNAPAMKFQIARSP